VNIFLLRFSAIAFVIGLFSILSSGCAVTEGGYGYDDGMSIGIGLDYYEPYGVDYGGWGSGYRVGPIRGGDHRPDRGGSRSPPHAYKSAPASHSMPSIPSRSRAGDARSHRRPGDP
jgi:hypothetical protein